MPKNSFVASYSFVSTDALLRQLRGVDMQSQETILALALREAAEPIVQDARGNLDRMAIPDTTPEEIVRTVRTGALKKSLGFVIRRYPTSGKLIAYIGPRVMEFAANASFTRSSRLTRKRQLRPSESKVVPAKYAHLVEFGFRHHSGKQVPARPFLRNAFEKNRFLAEGKLREGFVKALEKVFSRRSKSLEKKVIKLAA